MTHLVVLALLVGLADSANPTTIAPALYLAAGRRGTRSILGFTAGVFTVNLAAGLALILGPGAAILSFVPHPNPQTLHLIELAGGGALFLLAAALWLWRGRLAHHLEGNTERLDHSSTLAGAALMTVELPTAVPYFAVLAAVIGSHESIPAQVTAIIVFNVAFVAPMLAIAAVRAISGAGGRARLERARARLDARLAVLVPALVALVAAALVAIGALGLREH